MLIQNTEDAIHYPPLLGPTEPTSISKTSLSMQKTHLEHFLAQSHHLGQGNNVAFWREKAQLGRGQQGGKPT